MKAELELALLDGGSPAGLRRALESTAQETDRLVRLSNHLLMPTDVPLRREPLAAAALLDAVAERHRRRPDAAGRPIRTTADPDLVVLSDRLRLEQALGNLVDNALVHGLPASPRRSCGGARHRRRATGRSQAAANGRQPAGARWPAPACAGQR